MQYLLISLLLFTSLLATNDLDFEENFLQDLDEVSEIATKTKLNIDDTPSFITVLQSNKLKKLGVDNVFEALALVPGVQLTREISGVPVVIFRGATQKGEVKLMVDGVTINNSYRGSIYYYLDFPIEMVKRIEVIRGAGSVLYGSGAISGVVNIITYSSEKDSTDKIFISGGTYDNYKGGTTVSTSIDELKVSIDAYYQKNDKTVQVGANPSGLTGDSDRHLKDYSLGINISYEDLSLIARIKKYDIGNAYGILGVLDSDTNRYNNENTSIFAQLAYKKKLDSDNRLNILAGYINYMQDAIAAHPAGDIDADYQEDSYFSEINLISNSINNNELLLGAKFESTKTLTSQWRLGSNSIPSISNPDLSREITSIYLNDTYKFSQDFDISAGLRYDNYSDFGDSYSPNLGLVYRFNKKTKFKFLYSHSFRAPSWVELTSNKDLDAEKSQSIEAGIIFKQNNQNILRVNIFKSYIDNIITKDDITRKYVQNSKNNFKGVEVEYIYSPSNTIEFNIFASYINAQDDDENDLAGVSNILASTSLIYELNSGLTFGSLLKYTSDSKRSTTDIRDDMSSKFIFDETISYTFKKYSASLILKDLFDSGAYYALPTNSYEKDFDNDGRSFLLKASMEF